jgi:hypothetical protein
MSAGRHFFLLSANMRFESGQNMKEPGSPEAAGLFVLEN